MIVTPLKIKRKEKGILQRTLAEKVKISIRTYKYYESGKRIPDVVTAIGLAEELGISSYSEFKETFLSIKCYTNPPVSA